MKAAVAVLMGILAGAAGGVVHAQAKPDVIRIGYFANLTHAQALAGRANGAFEKALGPGVKIEWRAFNAGPSAIEALFADAIDVSYIGPNPTVTGFVRSQGEALRVIAGSTSGGASLVVRRGSGIEKAADFHGKRVATPQLGNTQDVALRAWLRANNLKSREKGGDVQIVTLANADQLTLFLKGELDAAWAPEPWASRLVHEGGGKILLDERDLWPKGEFVGADVIASTRFLREHADLVKKFLLAHVELTDWINQHPAEAKRLLNQQLQKETRKALSAQVLDDAFSRMRVTYDPLRASLLKSMQRAFDEGFLGRKQPDLSGLYDLTILNVVLAEKSESDSMSNFGGEMFSLLASFRSTVVAPEAEENSSKTRNVEKGEIRLDISSIPAAETESGAPQIAFRDVTRTYAGARGAATTALENISFTVSPGEFVCIVGPSGCGKSTLLHLAAGLDRPTSGEVRVGGAPVQGPGTDRILIFQELGLFPWLTAAENVEFGLKMAGMAKKERRERALEYLRMVHLSKFQNSQVHELSGGMKQRVALARSLALQPKILLMDEPFAALDAQTRDLLHDELERLWKETAATIIFVTHNVREAVRLGDRVMLMSFRPGKIKQQFRIHLPRPRHIEDSDVARSSKEILGQLREEIQRSRAAEYSHEEN